MQPGRKIFDMCTLFKLSNSVVNKFALLDNIYRVASRKTRSANIFEVPLALLDTHFHYPIWSDQITPVLPSLSLV